jgi:hypothetical protein
VPRYVRDAKGYVRCHFVMDALQSCGPVLTCQVFARWYYAAVTGTGPFSWWPVNSAGQHAYDDAQAKACSCPSSSSSQ